MKVATTSRIALISLIGIGFIVAGCRSQRGPTPQKSTGKVQSPLPEQPKAPPDHTAPPRSPSY